MHAGKVSRPWESLTAAVQVSKYHDKSRTLVVCAVFVLFDSFGSSLSQKNKTKRSWLLKVSKFCRKPQALIVIAIFILCGCEKNIQITKQSQG